MRRGFRPAWVLLVCVLLSGCAGWPLEEDDGREPAPGPAEPSDPQRARLEALRAALPPEPAPGPAARLSLDASPAWVKPRNVVELDARLEDAAAMSGASWSWFVSTNGSDVRVTNASGAFFLEGGTGEGTAHPARVETPRRVDTGLIPPASASPTIEFPQAARYTFVAPRHPDVEFHLNVQTDRTVAADVVEVVLVEDEHGFRFVPERLDVGPGARVRFVNLDVAAHAVTETRYWALVPWGAPRLEAVGVDTGWYEFLAVASLTDGATAEAYASALVDFESPPPRGAAGPFEARLSATPDDDVRSYPFPASYDVHTLELAVEVRAPAGVGAPGAEPRVEVRVLRESGGEELARETVETRARFVLSDLPAGAYRVEARLVEGPLVDVSLDVALRYDVRPPPAPAWVHVIPDDGSSGSVPE